MVDHRDHYKDVQLDWLFGFNPSCRPGNASSPDCTQPSVIIMLIIIIMLIMIMTEWRWSSHRFITVWLILNIIPRLPGCYTRQEITHSTLVKPPGSNNKKKHQGAWSWFWNCIYFCFLFHSSWFQYLFLRGIATNLFTTHWSIPEWQAEINVRWQIFEYSDINIFRFSYIPNTVTSIARLAMCFLFRYHCAPFCFRYYWSNTDKWQSSSGTGKSVPIRSSFVAFTVAIKSMQMSPNVIFFSSDVSLRAKQCHQTLVSTLK